ncbi:MAG: DNA polymerase IV [Promethearchaeota archaeon]
MEWKYVILHVDLDSFFASVHIKYNPFLKGFPVIIGSDPQKGNGRGVVSTCSYEARKFGLHSGMPISQAYNLCKHGVYICSGSQISFSDYHVESKAVMSRLQKYGDKFQQAGVDEAYIDATNSWQAYGSSPESIAKAIQTEIRKDLALSVSIGVAETKSIAKIASDLNKPSGITIVHNSELEEKIYHLPVRKIVGVGKKTENRLHNKEISSIGDIATMSRERAFLLLGDYGLYLRKVTQGTNYKEVGYTRGERKSIGSERTFGTDQSDWNLIESKVRDIISRLTDKLHKNNLMTRNVSIKIRFQGYETFMRSSSFSNYIDDEMVILNSANKLLNEFRSSSKKVRLIGVRVASLKSKQGQLTLMPFLSHRA